MEIKGKLVKVLPAQTGPSKSGGEWKKQEFVIELEGTYPRKACFTIWGDKVNIGSFVEGTMLNVFFDVDSREYNEKWFTNLTAWKVESAAESAPSGPQPLPPLDSYQPDMAETPSEKDDLPF